MPTFFLKLANDTMTAESIDSFEPAENDTTIDDLGLSAGPSKGKTGFILKGRLHTQNLFFCKRGP